MFVSSRLKIFVRNSYIFFNWNIQYNIKRHNKTPVFITYRKAQGARRRWAVYMLLYKCLSSKYEQLGVSSAARAHVPRFVCPTKQDITQHEHSLCRHTVEGGAERKWESEKKRETEKKKRFISYPTMGVLNSPLDVLKGSYKTF